MTDRPSQQKRKRFDFEATKLLATSKDRAVRKKAFVEYFEDFGEFPSYFFDNELQIDHALYQTMQDLLKDEDTSKTMRQGIEDLLNRLPS